MNILYNCYEYPPCKHGGVGTFYKDLAESLVKCGHKVTIVGVYYNNVLKLDKIIKEEINGVNIIRIPQYKKTGISRIDMLLSRIFYRRYLRGLLDQETFDIIESPEGSGWLPFGVSKKTQFITRLHVGQGVMEKMLNRKSSFLLKVFERLQLTHSDYIISVSEFIANATKTVYNINKQIQVIYNGIKIPLSKDFKKKQRENSATNILFYGSVDPKKGVKELIQAYIILIERGYDVKLFIAGKMGNQSYNEELYGLIPSNLKEKIIFCGALDRDTELFPLIINSDICCFPSKVEAFGLAPVEAMAFQKPVVFSKLGAGPEVIRDGIDGLLCNPYASADIAEKIAMFLDDEQLCHECSLSAFKRASELFSIDQMLENNIKFYQSCLKNSTNV